MASSLLPIPIPYPASESPSNQSLIAALNLTPHIEGGYFVETDRDPLLIPNPFPPPPSLSTETPTQSPTRNASTTIFYLLTPHSPVGCFHRNKGRTVHTLHHGKGTYVIIHPGEETGENGEGKGKARVEVFDVGGDVGRGEKLQWIVEGGKWKGSFLSERDGDGEGLLISETVVPGFEYVDHDFMPKERLSELVTAEQVEELGWLVRTEGSGK